METINHEYFASLEVAKLLKQAGFDWKCKSLYDSQDNYNGITFTPSLKNWNVSNKLDYSAPTLDAAQRWLREVKDIWCEVTICFVMEDALMKTKYHVQCISTDYNNSEMIDCHNIETDTPEEALEAGIKQALEIILEKGE